MTHIAFAEAERRRDAALGCVRGRYAPEIALAQARMLAAALGRDTAEYTADDATEPGRAYAGNAPWLGAAVRDLAHRRFVAAGGFARSARPSRKACFNRVWRVTDRGAAAAELARLRSLLAAHPDRPDPCGPAGCGGVRF